MNFFFPSTYFFFPSLTSKGIGTKGIVIQIYEMEACKPQTQIDLGSLYNSATRSLAGLPWEKLHDCLGLYSPRSIS